MDSPTSMTENSVNAQSTHGLDQSIAGSDGEGSPNEQGSFTMSLPTESITVKNAKVVVEDSIVFEKEGHVVGKLDAEYDFSNLPKHLHMSGLAMISKRKRLIICPDVTPEEKEELERMRNRPWWKFW